MEAVLDMNEAAVQAKPPFLAPTTGWTGGLSDREALEEHVLGGRRPVWDIMSLWCL